MTDYLPLFSANTARSGGGLISMMLSTNKDVMLAVDPYLELYRSMRNAFIRNDAPPDLQRVFDPASPLQDYYFTEERINIMDVIQAGDVDTPFDPKEWERFLKLCAARTGLDSADLVPHLSELRGSTYKQMFDNGLEIIAKVRGAENRKWVGIKDVWTIEFFAPLARAYPEARFIISFRDPRATANSMLGASRTYPEQAGHLLSYARHWRKLVAFTTRYQADPLFEGRLHILAHEHVLREPESAAQELCEFLDVDYDQAMLETDNYFDYATGATWTGNSAFEQVTSGISVHRAERWQTMLDPKIVKMVDFVCGPDMKLIGYEPVTDFSDQWPDPNVLEQVVDGNDGYANWRTDLGDPQQDYGFELFRRALLALPNRPLDTGLIRRSFLFEEAFDGVRQASLESAHIV